MKDTYFISNQIVAYANNLAIIVRSEEESKKVTRRVVEAAYKFGLKINRKKSKL